MIEIISQADPVRREVYSNSDLSRLYRTYKLYDAGVMVIRRPFRSHHSDVHLSVCLVAACALSMRFYTVSCFVNFAAED